MAPVSTSSRSRASIPGPIPRSSRARPARTRAPTGTAAPRIVSAARRYARTVYGFASRSSSSEARASRRSAISALPTASGAQARAPQAPGGTALVRGDRRGRPVPAVVSEKTRHDVVRGMNFADGIAAIADEHSNGGPPPAVTGAAGDSTDVAIVRSVDLLDLVAEAGAGLDAHVDGTVGSADESAIESEDDLVALHADHRVQVRGSTQEKRRAGVGRAGTGTGCAQRDERANQHKRCEQTACHMRTPSSRSAA